MKIVKELTFSDVNGGQISVATVTTNCPTLIKAVAAVSMGFDQSITATLTFDPVSGSDTSIRRIIGNTFPAGYAWDLDTSASASEPEGLYVEANGELKIELTGTAPSTGRLLLMVDVNTFPLT